MSDDGGDARPAWDQLPPELWREVLLRCPSDYDLGACLRAAHCFHVLTPGDLMARQYADATVEGMCAAGDLDGLEYTVAHWPAAAPPVDWSVCLCEAGIRGHAHVIAWIVNYAGILHAPSYWEGARTIAIETDDPLLRAMASTMLSLAGQAPPTTPYTLGALSRFNEMWAQAPAEAKAVTVRRCRDLGQGWLHWSESLCTADEPPPDLERAESLVRLDAEERACRTCGNADGAHRLARRLAEAVHPQMVNDLVRAGRLDAATSLMTNPAAHAGLPYHIIMQVIANVARASAEAGRIDLLDTLGCFDTGTSARLDIVTGGRQAHVWTVVVEAAAGSGHTGIMERIWGTPDAPTVVMPDSNAVAAAVVGGHVECVRWLCERGFPTASAKVWSSLWANQVSALSLALLARRTDMADIILASADADAAAHQALSEAVAAGDLRVARYIRHTRPSAPHQRPAPAPQRNPLEGLRFIPLDRDGAL